MHHTTTTTTQLVLFPNQQLSKTNFIMTARAASIHKFDRKFHLQIPHEINNTHFKSRFPEKFTFS